MKHAVDHRVHGSLSEQVRGDRLPLDHMETPGPVTGPAVVCAVIRGEFGENGRIGLEPFFDRDDLGGREGRRETRYGIVIGVGRREALEEQFVNGVRVSGARVDRRLRQVGFKARIGFDDRDEAIEAGSRRSGCRSGESRYADDSVHDDHRYEL